MGRKSLGLRETKVRLTVEQFESIVEIAGTRGMAEFIRRAVHNELARISAGSAADRNLEANGPANAEDSILAPLTGPDTVAFADEDKK